MDSSSDENEFPGLIWEERQMAFTSQAMGTEKEFSSLFKSFGKRIKLTYSSGTKTSLDMWDAWKVRRMGPCVSGKIASNAYWYMSFTKEHGTWKLWRLEATTH